MNKRPIAFVCLCVKSGKWRDLLNDPELSFSEEELAHRIVNNEECWVILSYLRLRDAGLPVILTTELQPNTICVLSYLHLYMRWLVRQPKSAFVIGCLGDGPSHAPFADHCVVQSPLQIGRRASLIPLWPQPGLLPRRVERGTRVESLTFKGSLENLWAPFRSPAFLSKLAARGVRLDLGLTVDSRGVAQCHDYRENDLVLAARNLTVADAAVKPPSKLINAWHAGVPALLGPEPAFQALRRDELDYFEVRSPEDILCAIDLLQREPQRYRAMVDRGRERALEFTNEAVVERWRSLLWETAADAMAGRDRLRVWSGIAKRIAFPWHWVQHRRSKLQAIARRSHGPRVLSEDRAVTLRTIPESMEADSR